MVNATEWNIFISRERDLRSTGIKICPGRDELPEVVRAEDGGVPGQVVEVVHDDGHEQVEHDEATEEDEGDEVNIGDIGATGLVRVYQEASLVPLVSSLITGPAGQTVQHDVWPGLTSGAPEHITGG